MQVHSWEPSLLSLAYEAVNSVVTTYDELRVEQESMRRAYEHVTAVTSERSRSFSLASSLLPTDKRRAARALYAFCRTVDDIVDEGGGKPSELVVHELERWRHLTLFSRPPAQEPVALAWADTRTKYAIPQKYAEQLIEGVARDLRQTRYNSFEDLATYCYGVASTVGLMTMHIIGYASSDAIPYAIKLGVALQITNVLRDVGEDWGRGRVYLPQDELGQFLLTDDDIANGVVDDRWRSFMRFQIDRNRQLYEEARPGIALLDADGRFAIAAASNLYSAILDDIEARDYDVFTQRAHVGTIKKLRMLPHIWWQSRF